MTAGISLELRTILQAPEVVIGNTHLLAESEALVLRLPRAAFVLNRPLAVTVIRDVEGQRVQFHAQPRRGAKTMIETLNGAAPVSETEQVGRQTFEFLDKILAAAEPSAVFSAPVVSGEYTVITASQVFAGGLFGFGGGAGPAHDRMRVSDTTETALTAGRGGGGVGGSHSRPVAAVIIGPDGVKIKPIVDATRIALAAMSAWGAVAFMAARIARARGNSMRRAYRRASR